MRKSVLAALGLGGLLLALAAAGSSHRPSPPPSVMSEIAPSPAPAAREIARATAPVATPQETAQPAMPAAPDLPTVEVAPLPVHVVPEEDAPAPTPKASPFGRTGRTLALPDSARGTARSFPPPVAPIIAGAAEASGGTTLAVAGRAVRLFGVRTPEPGEQCGAGSGGQGNCTVLARDALVQRLRHSPQVSCQVPPGQRGSPGAICVDASGTDLGRFLVAEGLALADTSQSYEYFGAEGVARSQHRGVWGHR